MTDGYGSSVWLEEGAVYITRTCTMSGRQGWVGHATAQTFTRTNIHTHTHVHNECKLKYFSAQQNLCRCCCWRCRSARCGRKSRTEKRHTHTHTRRRWRRRHTDRRKRGNTPEILYRHALTHNTHPLSHDSRMCVKEFRPNACVIFDLCACERASRRHAQRIRLTVFIGLLEHRSRSPVERVGT